MITKLYFLIALVCIPIFAATLEVMADRPTDKSDVEDMILLGSVGIVSSLIWPIVIGGAIFLFIAAMVGRFATLFSNLRKSS